MKLTQIFTLLSVLVLSACEVPTDQDKPEYFLGEPELAGKACEDSRAFISEDGQEVIVDLSEFTLQAGGPYRSLQRGNCTLAVPFEVPENYQVAIVPAKLKGSHDLKEDTKLSLSMHTFLAGNEGVKSHKAIEKEGLGDFEIGGYRDLDNVEFSKCGGDVTLRVNFSAFLKTKNKEEESHSSIATLANENGGAFTLIFKSCKKK
ncbi:MAG: DUF4360 domain-containing protein [Bacteriovoracaceae bacterium]|nr:DUF4360 domain-containing protein [Bacteriovoracaceae bacterium]